MAEGDTDEVFLGRVIARQLRDLTDLAPRSIDVQSVQYSGCRMTRDDNRTGAAVEELAGDCHVIFLHSDHRERDKADRLAAHLADRGVKRPIVSLVPVKETEAWLLVDPRVWERVPGADTGVLPARPREAERIQDPKAVLRRVLAGVGHRKVGEHFAFAGDHVDLAVPAQLPAYATWLKATSDVLREQGFLGPSL